MTPAPDKPLEIPGAATVRGIAALHVRAADRPGGLWLGSTTWCAPEATDSARRPSGRRVGGCLRSPRGERHSECGNVMGRDADRLGQLARIARVKADGELRTYSARRAQADAMQRQVDAVRDELTQAIASPGSDALEQWRQTTALVGYRSEQLQQAEAALNRIRPGLETARQAAIRAFGRAEALTQLQALTRAQSDLDRQRRGG